jgi:hypothetical protein
MLEQISWLLLGLIPGVTIGGILFLDLLRKISIMNDKVIRATYSNILRMCFVGLVTHACSCSIFLCFFNTLGMLQMIGWSSGVNPVGIYSPID